MTSTPLPAFADVAGRFTGRIEDALDQYTPPDPDCPPVLREAIRHSLLGAGKRLRPLLVLLAAEACGAAPEEALPAACAVEMVHTYSLIHDDLPAMDDDDVRRGRASCHRQYGEAVAILAGDALLARALEILARDVRPPAVAAACCAALAAAAGPTALVGGQVDDLRAEQEGGDLAALEAIHRRKTGALIRVSLSLGALVARADAPRRAALDTYGRHLGVAFQIVDDLLDLQGDETAMGKRAGKDAARGKLTFPGVLGVAPSRTRAARLVTEACDALLPLGERGGDLQALARYVLERNG
ncbi:MAG: polyprenyl synthetase family protein [Pirellulaceae bacterium]|jgi:geranylgeranyl diphosphate synthase type II|nr:polyprenyl synthetase family protein [Pirellulaceae bacterium]